MRPQPLYDLIPRPAISGLLHLMNELSLIPFLKEPYSTRFETNFKRRRALTIQLTAKSAVFTSVVKQIKSYKTCSRHPHRSFDLAFSSSTATVSQTSTFTDLALRTTCSRKLLQTDVKPSETPRISISQPASAVHLFFVQLNAQHPVAALIYQSPIPIVSAKLL